MRPWPNARQFLYSSSWLGGGLDPSRSLGIVPEYYILPSVLPVFSKHNIVSFSALPTVEPESNRSFHLWPVSLVSQQHTSLLTKNHCYLWSIVNQCYYLVRDYMYYVLRLVSKYCTQRECMHTYMYVGHRKRGITVNQRPTAHLCCWFNISGYVTFFSLSL